MYFSSHVSFHGAPLVMPLVSCWKLDCGCLITCRIIRTTLLLSMEMFEPFPGYYFFNVLLMVLQALHVFWAGLILRMVYKFLKGKVRNKSMSFHNFSHLFLAGINARIYSGYKKVNAPLWNFRFSKYEDRNNNNINVRLCHIFNATSQEKEIQRKTK